MIVEAAPIWKRLLAYVYDALILTALVLVATLIAALLAGGESPAWLTQLFIAGFTLGYFWISWFRGGKTAGMRAWRLRVVTESGHPLNHRHVLVRLLACLGCLAPLGITLLTGWFSADKQTVYDRISATRVVAEPKGAKPSATNATSEASTATESEVAK